VQVRVVPVAETHRVGAADLADELRARGVRADVDASEETLGKRIRSAEIEKIPYVLVFGDKEAGGGTLAVRTRGRREVVELDRSAALDEIEQAATL
jgi:threonyl-tRNA synthetase